LAGFPLLFHILAFVWLAVQPAAGEVSLAFAGAGYAFGGRQVHVTLPMPAEREGAVVVQWRIEMNGAEVASDRSPVVDGAAEIPMPEVRARSELRVHWRLFIDERSTAHGTTLIVLLPPQVLEGLQRHLEDVHLVVIASADAMKRSGLAALLDLAGAEYRRVDRAVALRLARPDLVLVAPGGMSGPDPADSAVLIEADANDGSGHDEHKSTPRPGRDGLLAEAQYSRCPECHASQPTSDRLTAGSAS
jgi:hypothetical protein